MTNSRVPLAIATAVLATLTGCASTGGTETAATPSADPANQQRQTQTQLAACMKGRGFTYHPMVSMPELPDAVKQEISGDYSAMKKYRSKYGFGFAASIIYPNDGVGRMARQVGEGDSAKDPNGKVVAGLSKPQQEAYFQAMEACNLELINKATGKKHKSMQEAAKAQSEMMKQIISREIDGDPKLTELARAFADCLKGKGYQVTSQRPSDIARSTESSFLTEFGKLGGKRQPTADEARPLLQREIKAALDDLECGKDFYAAYRPKANEVYKRAELLPGLGMTVAVKG
ncbi:hypothetical protein [Nonomuraea jabiensis]|uniref:DUF3829 domain-containing protein n=1 Tax=Nonomuraea jabiensis TaxID=882448 RepID=A0A7W9GEE6_9ACTN|nr:hypothetical protein [Nonomuraea jabiensis]MBB5782315.1 hypothetical protein [Nonomuraea jabiensis]